MGWQALGMLLKGDLSGNFTKPPSAPQVAEAFTRTVTGWAAIPCRVIEGHGRSRFRCTVQQCCLGLTTSFEARQQGLSQHRNDSLTFLNDSLTFLSEWRVACTVLASFFANGP